MADHGFEHLSIFLVEDNPHVRNDVVALLRHLNFRRVATAGNGAEAIESLVPPEGSHIPSIGEIPDIIISDLVMAPVNGLLFLKWVRTSRESPNRFIPFIMLSGAANLENLRAALELGVTEFLAKPVSVETVSRHIAGVVHTARQFVVTHSFLGPDRRRRVAEFKAERRTITEEEVTVVHSADQVIRPGLPSKVWHFRLPNHLEEKAQGLHMDPAEIPFDLLEEAEEHLERAALDFTEWAVNYMSDLSSLCAEAAEDAPHRRSLFDKINLLADELKGQGGTFGYPLITTFGRMLHEATEPDCSLEDDAVEIVRAHVDAMRAILREKIAGDGGKVGRALLKSLRAAIDKHSAVT